MYAWLTLPQHWRASEFAAAAQSDGVRLTPGAAFAMDHTQPRAVRISFGCPPTREVVKDGLDRLRRLLDRRPVEEFQTMA
jgi:DNA-binding transcriptional MocR family regulator